MDDVAELDVQRVMDEVRRTRATVEGYMDGQPIEEIRSLILGCAFWALQNGAEDVAINALYVSAAVLEGERH